ncbi:hypothetical protein ACFYT4_29210 [Streptomyces sp. NPDC004609]|uniref:hypothetical protein n=1 Tax=Streptomyces sp. NPDC004609 TaxID=3364704 RepID=UPI0036CFD246
MKTALIRRALGGALVLGTVAGGLGYTAATVDGADRTAPTTTWGKPAGAPAEDPAGDVGRGRASTPLGKLLLPVPENYRLGPDRELYGNDQELTGKQAAAVMKDEGRGLTGEKRREFEKIIDRLGVRGIASRTYALFDNTLVVQVEVARMKSGKDVRTLYDFKAGLSELVGLKKGPKIEGHKKAACFMLPMDHPDEDRNEDGEDTGVDRMTCTAYVSDMLVSVSAYGSRPFDKSAATSLVKRQLDHLTSPGEYV